MQVEDDYLVCIAEETEFFVSHLYGSMVHVSEVFYCGFQFFRVEFDLRVCHCDWNEFLCDLVELLFLASEIFEAVCNVCALYLFAAEVINLNGGFGNILLAEVDHLRMLLKILLLPRDASFFHFDSLAVFDFDFGLLQLDLFDDFVEVVINLVHGVDFALLHFS